jgi:hypothetical protein
MLRRLTRPLWLLAALVFLFEAWLWDRLTDFGHWLARRLPFEALKAWVTAKVQAAPPTVALLLFLIPVIVVQPLKLVSLWLMTHGHLAAGALGFVSIKLVGFGLVAFLFDLTREKLLTIRWFAWVYARVIRLRDIASAFIAPYKAAVKAMAARLKARALAFFPASDGRQSRLARLRSRLRGR